MQARCATGTEKTSREEARPTSAPGDAGEISAGLTAQPGGGQYLHSRKSVNKQKL